MTNNDSFKVVREAVPNPEDGGKTTLHMASIVHTVCGKVELYVKNADKKMAVKLARRFHRMNGGGCSHCSKVVAVSPELAPDAAEL